MRQFTETQRFRQWWLWLTLIASMAIMPGIMLIVYLKGSDPELTLPLIGGVSVVPVVVLVLFSMMKLETKIDETGIYYKFLPPHFSFRQIQWDEVESVAIRRYNPIGEYGGWGLRYSFKHGKAFNVSGSMGLQIILKNGKKVLIGTGKSEELEMVLRDLGKL